MLNEESLLALWLEKTSGSFPKSCSYLRSSPLHLCLSALSLMNSYRYLFYRQQALLFLSMLEGISPKQQMDAIKDYRRVK
jgi:hypothetical protein